MNKRTSPLLVVAMVALATGISPSQKIHHAAAQGTLTVSATVMGSVTVILEPDGQAKVISANMPDKGMVTLNVEPLADASDEKSTAFSQNRPQATLRARRALSARKQR